MLMKKGIWLLALYLFLFCNTQTVDSLFADFSFAIYCQLLCYSLVFILCVHGV